MHIGYEQLLVVILVGAASCSSVTRFELSDPCASISSNTDLWISANEIGNSLGEHVRSKIGDDTGLKRLGIVATELWWAEGMRFYAHEVAHQVDDAKIGAPQSIGFDFSDIRTNLWPDFYDHEISLMEKFYSRDDIIWSTVAGLNQDETTAKSIWRQAVLSNQLQRNRALMMGTAKLLDMYYLIMIGLDSPAFVADPAVDYDGIDVMQLFKDKSIPAWDADVYYVLMESKHHRITKLDMLAHYALADVMSWAAWWPIAQSYKYVKSGDNDTTIPTIKIAGVPIGPPIWSSYMTPEGFFHEISTVAGVGRDFPVEISVGFPLRLGDDGYLSCFRFGARLWDTRQSKITVSPYAYVCYIGDEQGGTLGLELSVGTKASRFWIRGQYSEDDIIENGACRLDRGFQLTTGIELRN